MTFLEICFLIIAIALLSIKLGDLIRTNRIKIINNLIYDLNKNKIPPTYLYSYVGSFVKCLWVIILLIVCFGILNYALYLLIILVLFFILMLHIRDITGQSIDKIFNQLNPSLLSKNPFIVFTVTLSISMFILSIILIIINNVIDII